jgi:hypothetical protein
MATKTKTKTQKKAGKETKGTRKSKAATVAAEAVAATTTTTPGACPRGGDHEWTAEGESRFCLKCLEPAEATTKAKGKRTKVKATTAKKPEPKESDASGKLSAIDAAAKVLAEAGQPLNTKQMIEAMATKGYWTSPGGKTPHATLYSAILREITANGNEARFKKTERGHFAING